MIEFITLLLGLVAGEQRVEVMVADGVAAVELQLDGEAVSALEGEPWAAVVDFGDDLSARELVAVAFDGAGTEVGRAAQPLNQPRPQAAASILLERDANGRAAWARLEWQSVVETAPVAAKVTFDDRELEVENLARFPLPSHDPEAFHVLYVDLYFALGVSTQAQLAFGGFYLDETSGELTSLVVRPIAGGRVRSLIRLENSFSSGGSEIPVAAIERGPAEVIFVRGRRVQRGMREFEPTPGGRMVPTEGRQQSALALPKSHRVRVLMPYATHVHRGHLEFDTFILSTDLGRSGGVFWALSQPLSLAGASPDVRLADAVAMAGVQAALGNRRRAIVLVTRDSTPEASSIRPQAVVDYLRDLDVPLHVWHMGDAPPPAGWPAATRIADYGDLRRAFRALEKDLDRQRVVWLGGDYPKGSITIASDAGVERLGAAPFRD